MGEEVLSSLMHGSLEPVLSLITSTKRVYLPFLIGAGVISALVWALKLRGRCSLPAFLFPRRIWLSPSALLDYRLMFVRAILSALLLWPFVVSSLEVAVFVSKALGGTFGREPLGGAPPWVTLAAFTLTGFLAEDFARYMVHRLAHRVPVLWELHKVHHSATVLTPFTVYRTHPFESVLMRAGAALGVGVAAGVCVWAFGGRVAAWQILGVHAVSFVWNLAGSNLRHSHVWVSYGRVLEHLFISPAQHQIHHSDDVRHYHRNYGSTLAVWDWIGGSLYVPRTREKITFGLPPDVQNHRGTVVSVLLSPLAAVGSTLRAQLRRGTAAASSALRG